ncbi:hypothetical protein RZS28_12670 [Methylocapsa polymorpha]|uniref:Flagellar protein FlgN n=1 Tax=Methylocapsa polymorpha TaxID=3080828 RepID=A0ABZ0HQN4_9HYPH|nr:hypothetical protein RZS28_12670 [Methylocapsa sp. RX1]
MLESWKGPIANPSESLKADGFVEPSDIARKARSTVMLEAFVGAVERLERTLDRETEMLRQHQPIALHDFNHEKSHALLELSRTLSAMRAIDPGAFECDAKEPLARLRLKLEGNLAILQTHLTAVGEIAAIIARAIQDHESDGTYTTMLNRSGRAR